MKIIIILLIIILIISIINGLLIYIKNQNEKKNKNNQFLQDLLKIQIEKIKEQVNKFKELWSISDLDKNEKLINLIININNFQKNLDKKENDYKRNADVIQKQVIDIIKDLTKLKESSLILDKVNDNIKKLQEIFINSKKRGNIGEFILEKILNNMLGSNQKIWKKQYKTIDGKFVDAYIKTNSEKEGIAIDSKFSIDNYQKYLASQDIKIKENYLKNFRNDIRKRIDEVTKYINIENKISSAVMFIPSEEIFAFIYEQFSDDIIEYAFKKHVWITSPTTLSAILFTINKNQKDIDFNKNLEKIAKKLYLFKDDFNRWIDRWEKIKINFNIINKSIENLDKTHNKITGHYNNIFEMSEEIQESK